MGRARNLAAASKIQEVPKIRFVVATYGEVKKDVFTKTRRGRLIVVRLPFVVN
jgi:hypothetical protein